MKLPPPASQLRLALPALLLAWQPMLTIASAVVLASAPGIAPDGVQGRQQMALDSGTSPPPFSWGRARVAPQQGFSRAGVAAARAGEGGGGQLACLQDVWTRGWLFHNAQAAGAGSEAGKDACELRGMLCVRGRTHPLPRLLEV